MIRRTRSRDTLARVAQVFLAAAGLAAPAWAWDTHIYGPHYLAAQTETDQVPESSGVVASTLTPDVYWTHNDSGHPPRLWVVRLTDDDETAGVAANLGHVDLPGASASDWEDIAIGPDHRIYVFDGGDNPPCERTNKRIHRFIEPAIDPNGPPVALSVSYESIRFEYPDATDPNQPADQNGERYDCESLAVHPTTGDVYLVTKRNNSSLPVSYVFKLVADELVWGSASVHVLEFVADLSVSAPLFPTGMDFDADGHRIVVRNYTTAYEFTGLAAEPFEAIFQTTPVTIGISGEPQGEGICYRAGGGDLITTSEATGSGSQPINVYRVPWRLANVQTASVTATWACIRWQTRDALDSQVDYGETTAYGSFVSDSDGVTQHDLFLPDLTPETRYYFRVESGTLEYPPPADAHSVYFETASCGGADLDGDGDTDLADVAVLQSCSEGGGVTVPPECAAADLDADGDVDATDLAVLQSCLTAPVGRSGER